MKRGVMKHMMKKLIVLGILGVAAAILCQPVCASGIGISPTTISVSDVMRGEICEEMVTIFNPNAEEIRFILETDGQAAEWLSFYDYNNENSLSEGVIPPKDKQTLRVIIEIPPDASNGRYDSAIYASTQPNKKTGLGEIQAVFTATSHMTIEVTDIQRLSGTVDYIGIRDGEVNVPLPIEVKFTNTGNVIAKPAVTIVIRKDGGTIDQVTAKAVEIKPGLSEIILETWDTAEIKSGKYTADVSVSLDGSVIEDKTVSFEIFPVGTMTHEGEFVSLKSDGTYHTGTLLKIIGTFKNTGTLGASAQLTGEVLKNGNLIGTIESKELMVPVYSSKQLTSYLDLTDTGEYVVKAHIIYGGKETDEKELTFTVSDAAGVPGSSAPSKTKTPLSPIPTISALLIAGICMALQRKEK
jgi:hypothetical protein